jgi:nucleoside-diphosphate-sugar epimerase
MKGAGRKLLRHCRPLHEDSLKPPHRPRLLIVGCGDIGMRVLRLWRRRCKRQAALVLTSSPARLPLLRAVGAVPLLGDLDDAKTLWRLGALADVVLYLAPPPASGEIDRRSRHLQRALARGGRAHTLVYASTSGVYGDCGGGWVSEARALSPATDRAWRRFDAETCWRQHGRASGCRVSLLRVPGIYALDREGGDPRERVRCGTPVLAAADDVHTNHIHADDLARACLLALHRALPGRAVNISDDSDLRMGDYFDLVADGFGLPRPPRLSRAQAAEVLSPVQMSFLSESRRLDNQRMKRELRLKLAYPTVLEGLGLQSQ